MSVETYNVSIGNKLIGTLHLIEQDHWQLYLPEDEKIITLYARSAEEAAKKALPTYFKIHKDKLSLLKRLKSYFFGHK